VVSQSPLAGGVGVDGEFSLGFLEAFWMEVEQTRPRLFQLGVRDGDRNPAKLGQRNALLSLSKNPSSGR
jgi:hypothetical protein